MSKVVLDISMSLDGLVAQADDDPGPIQEFFFSGETEHDGMSGPRALRPSSSGSSSMGWWPGGDHHRAAEQIG